jgi:hypothetical protein
MSARGLDRLVGGVDHAGAMHMQGNDLHILELVRCHRLHVLPVGLGGGFGIVHHERQLEHLDARETAGGVAGQGPDDVHHAVLGLVIQLHRRAAELHGRIGLELDAPARLGLHLRHPGLVHVEPHIGLRRHEGMELEGHRLLGERGQARCAERGGCGAGFQQGATLNHGCLRKKTMVVT